MNQSRSNKGLLFPKQTDKQRKKAKNNSRSSEWLLFPKPTPKRTEKQRKKAKNNQWVKWVRERVFERDEYACRMCKKQAEEMHDIKFRSLGGLVSLNNSIAVCRSCHREIQQLRVDVIGDDANGELEFVPHVYKKTNKLMKGS